MMSLLCVLIVGGLFGSGYGVDVTVESTQISSWTVSKILTSVGIEYLNHEIYGNGLYGQQIFGESFEEVAGSYGPASNTKQIASAGNNNERIRHCDYDLYQTNVETGDPAQDFDFILHTPGLNGQANTVSFESSNFNNYYISMDNKNGLENTRLGLIPSANTADYKDSSTFNIVAALNGNSNQVSYTSCNKSYDGYYVVANGKLEGECASQYKSADSDMVLLQQSEITNKDLASFSLESGSSGPPSENGYIGCGRGRATSANVVDNISEMWQADYLPASNAKKENLLQQYGAYKLVTNAKDAFNGNQYQAINFAQELGTNGFSSVGVANYGVNCQLGLFIVANKDYSGYIYLRNPSTNSVSVELSLQDWMKSNAILDSVTLSVGVNGNKWSRYNFNFTNKQSYNSTCNTDSDGHFQCSGKFVIYLTKPGDMIHVDLTYLVAGSWGIRNYTGSGSLGLPARKDLMDYLQYEGMKVVRMGGSMCNRDTYRWKFFRGPRDLRQPYPGLWYQQSGLTQSRGFGMFEVIDSCNEIGCPALITINNQETPDDMADFVEYCWGNGSTTYGAMRISDGHPDVYNVSWIEIGNEQGLTSTLLNEIKSITSAMDKKCQSVGAPMFRYCIGHNLGGSDLSNPLTTQYINDLKPLGNRIFWDLHVGADPDGVAGEEAFVTNFENLVNSLKSEMRFVILEENGGDHGLLRGLGHAAYNSIFIKHGSFGIVHGYANAIEGWQAMDKEKAFPQGQLFYTPNMTFGQTTFYVNRMLNEMYQPYNVNVSVSGGSNTLNVVATTSSNSGSTKDVNVYITNWGDDVSINLKVNGATIGNNNDLSLYILKGQTGDNDEENSPSQPVRIYPAKQTSKTTQSLTVKHNSFVIASFTMNT